MLDLDHLARQTAGDRGLQRQVLQLFLAQIDVKLAEMRSGGSASELRDAAHGVVGSARAIGAFEVARVAERICSSEEVRTADLTELTSVADQTRASIVDYLAQSVEGVSPNP